MRKPSYEELLDAGSQVLQEAAEHFGTMAALAMADGLTICILQAHAQSEEAWEKLPEAPLPAVLGALYAVNADAANGTSHVQDMIQRNKPNIQSITNSPLLKDFDA